MGTAAAIVSIAVTLLFAGQSVASLLVSAKNQILKNYISRLMSSINSEISKHRLDASRLLALLQNKNSSAMMNYLQNNPVISKNLINIQNDSDLIAAYQAEQSSLESEIASLQNELQTLGYSQSYSGTKSENEQASKVRAKLNNAVGRYKKLNDKIKNSEISTTNPVQTITSDIDARSQNINGGINNNGL